MKKSKEAKFFCESCGNEVGKNAKVCPTCGKFFASVRCPQCGRTGNTDEFTSGCQTCGYAVNPDGGYRKNSGFFGQNNNSKNNRMRQKDFSFFSSYGSRNNRSNQGDGSLPVWIYIFCVLVLIGLVVLLYSCLK